MKLTTELRSQVVEIDGAEYRLRELTSGERDQYELSMLKDDGKGGLTVDREDDEVKARLVHFSLRDVKTDKHQNHL